MKSLTSPRDCAAIRTRLLTLAPADTPRWGRMTVNQVLCHLADANDAAAGRRLLADPDNPPPLPASIPNLPKPVLTFVALTLPMRWPPGVPTLPSVEQGVGGTPPTGFAPDLTRLLNTFETLTNHTGPWQPHPFFGPLTTAQWMRWAYLHHDHHLRQFGH